MSENVTFISHFTRSNITKFGDISAISGQGYNPERRKNTIIADGEPIDRRFYDILL